jgi:hypothetical protein
LEAIEVMIVQRWGQIESAFRVAVLLAATSDQQKGRRYSAAPSNSFARVRWVLVVIDRLIGVIILENVRAESSQFLGLAAIAGVTHEDIVAVVDRFRKLA